MESNFKGQFGVVLLPDITARKTAIELASYISGNEISLGERHEPHLTLYHTKIDGMSMADAENLLERVAASLPVEASLEEVGPFGGRFVFWDAHPSRELSVLHTVALEKLSKFFSPEGEQQAQKEKLDLSPEQLANMRTYGHPLVAGLWRPHVTLGYKSDGVREGLSRHAQIVKFERAAFVEVGEYGTLKRIIAQR